MEGREEDFTDRRHILQHLRWQEMQAFLMAEVFNHTNVDIAIVQDIKLKHPKLARQMGFGYNVRTTITKTGHCGGFFC